MELISVLFYIMSSVAVLAALGVVFARNPVYAALFLVVTFISVAGLWLLLESELLAIVLIVVYVGAVMVLFLFVLMMIDVNIAHLRQGFWRYLPLGLVVGVMMTAQIVWAILQHFVGFGADIAPSGVDYSSVSALGLALFTDYLLPFELAGMLLLLAIIVAIALTHRGPRDRRVNVPGQQIAVKAEDRIRLVDIPSSNKKT